MGTQLNKLTRRIGWRLVAVLAIGVLSGCASPKTTGNLPTTQETVWGDDAFALSELADQAYRESRWIDAVRHSEELTQRVPEDPYSWFRLGNTYARQGDYNRAIPAYEASLERNAAQPKPWFNLSSTYLLNAQQAMFRARAALRPGDPARRMLDQRLSILESLIHDRFEDSLAPGTNAAFR